MKVEKKNYAFKIGFYLKESIILSIEPLNTPPHMTYVLHVCENIKQVFFINKNLPFLTKIYF